MTSEVRLFTKPTCTTHPSKVVVGTPPVLTNSICCLRLCLVSVRLCCCFWCAIIIIAVFGMLDSRSSGEVTRCQEDRFVDEGVVVTVEVDEEVERELAGDLKRATSGRVVLRRLENNEDDGR